MLLGVRILCFVLAAVTAACTAAPFSPESMRGCWTARRDPDWETARWFPDPERDGAWRGEIVHFGATGVQSSRRALLPRGDGGWDYVWFDEDGATERRRARLAPGRESSGPNEIGAIVTADTLYLTERLPPMGLLAIEFEGRRERCE